ncbi:MAG TPA: hypothetical protein VJX92_04995 [Methylomirabilota bacterium]|nr:hypothetical protein [Methylomirabilota bacterium]
MAPERMTPKRVTLAAVLVLTVVFLSPIAYLAGQRAGAWLTTPAAEHAGTGTPWPSLDDNEHDPGSMGERLKPGGRSAVAEI